jgi:hypothetical protein
LRATAADRRTSQLIFRSTSVVPSQKLGAWDSHISFWTITSGRKHQGRYLTLFKRMSKKRLRMRNKIIRSTKLKDRYHGQLNPLLKYSQRDRKTRILAHEPRLASPAALPYDRVL